MIEDFYGQHEEWRTQHRCGVAAEMAGKVIMTATQGKRSPLVDFRTGHQIAAERWYDRLRDNSWLVLLVNVANSGDEPVLRTYAQVLEDMPAKLIEYPDQIEVPSHEGRQLDHLQVAEAFEAIQQAVTPDNQV